MFSRRVLKSKINSMNKCTSNLLPRFQSEFYPNEKQEQSLKKNEHVNYEFNVETTTTKPNVGCQWGILALK